MLTITVSPEYKRNTYIYQEESDKSSTKTNIFLSIGNELKRNRDLEKKRTLDHGRIFLSFNVQR